MIVGTKHSVINLLAYRWELFENLLEIFYAKLLAENYNFDTIDVTDELKYVKYIANTSLKLLCRTPYEFANRVPRLPFPKLTKSKRTNKIQLQKPIGFIMPNSEWEEPDAYGTVDPRETYELLRQSWENMLNNAQSTLSDIGIFIAAQFPEFDEIMEGAEQEENNSEDINSLKAEHLEHALELLPFSFSLHASKFLYNFTEHMHLLPEWAYVFYMEPKTSKLDSIKSKWNYISYKIYIKRKSVFKWLNLPSNIEFDCEPVLVKNVKLTLLPRRKHESCF